MRPHRTPSSFHKIPVTGLGAQRRFALFYGWVLGGVAITLLFLPLAMAAGEADFGAALSEWYAREALIVVLPGLFLWAVMLGPVWFALRLWIVRQGDRPLGPRPATLPVWMAIWVGFLLVQLWQVGEDGRAAPPGVLALIPAPFDLLFNPILLAQMGGVTVMFLVYRRQRPQDEWDNPRGPIVSTR
ncbi:hypothetical protein [Roseicyclus persicicus]|uniref:Uncharacterized protein n=1 Tax=Roseicyclus persicicus TaxID=2650661 RepID=A0A7X6JYV3_9RHOB|nr:hypothetical protein [Roseibacterium persicicum]NKX46275.1 hypothetical protein [Roseibacterium persicicum]